jgi:hypothetical protein
MLGLSKKLRCLFLLASVTSCQIAAADEYIWCYAEDVRVSVRKVFISKIFVGDYGQQRSYKSAFTDAIRAKFPDITPSADCSAARDERSARDQIGDRLYTAFRGLEVVQIGWPP